MRPLIHRRRDVPRRDPAPSKWAYRVQRLWLTPVFRSLLRVGVPAFLIVGGLGLYATDPANISRVQDSVAEIRRSVEDRPEFRVNLMSIDGATPILAEEIRTTLSLDFPMSSFDLDLARLRERIEGIRAVASAELRIRSGGELAVTVAERRPAMIWQAREGLWVIDGMGARVAPLLARPRLDDLPVISGDGANEAAGEALALFHAARPLGDRLQGLVRMGERRWDVVLTEGPRILLPADRPVPALDRVLALHDAQELLDRDVVRVDLRDASRTVLQLTPQALAELRRMRALEETMEEGNG
ncbi:cell division protein FtsQ [Rhodobacteraceae bacterium W635]|uniref:cell division protein FtsQ/DivIB n=1 Tax=Nioella halotolerans TaxID=2303578 RepID=UPI000E3CAAEC|nr:cell division protein FtsQ [Rhodobacteraceae bacterium W635]